MYMAFLFDFNLDLLYDILYNQNKVEKMATKYTYEYCKEVTERYTIFSEFFKEQYPVFDAMAYRGWHHLSDHMIKRPPKKEHTLEYCSEKFKLYRSNADMRKSPDKRTLALSREKGWYEELSKLFTGERETYTYEQCKEIALRYEWLPALSSREKTVYNTIIENKWDDLLAHLDNHGEPLSKDFLHSVFLKYETLQEIKKSPDLVYYTYAHNREMVPELSTHMVRLRRKYTYERCFVAFLSCRTMGELCSKHLGIWQWSKDNGFLEEFSSHMPKSDRPPDGTWTKEAVRAEFTKRTKLSQVRIEVPTAYSVAGKNRWTEEFSEHMTGYGGTSNPEDDLRKIIAITYPSVRMQWFGKNKSGEIANKFQLDMYIPELNKAIEFNGNYWHSFEVMKRSRPKWPEEMILNYHEIKKQFFLARSISYIEIWGDEWDEDREDCIRRCLEFLKAK